MEKLGFTIGAVSNCKFEKQYNRDAIVEETSRIIAFLAKWFKVRRGSVFLIMHASLNLDNVFMCR